MRRVLWMLMALPIAACVTTPDELRQQGIAVTAPSERSATQAAACVIANSERMQQGLLGTVHEMLGSPGVQEVTVRIAGATPATLLVAEITPAPSGSTMKLWTRRGPDTPWLGDVTKGC